VNKLLYAARQRTALCWFIAAATVFVLLATACSGGSESPKVARVDSQSANASTSSATSSAASNPIAYSQCMRDHGVARFPDPDSAGRLQLVRGSDLDPGSTQFRAADEACKSLRPQGTPDEQQQDREEWLKFARCMRANGIANFPDPRPDGKLLLPLRADGSPSVDTKSPQWQAADKACKLYSPGGGSSGGVGG
jgi:hypothetical protein